MSDESVGVKVLKTALQVAARETSEEIGFGLYKQLLGLIFKEALILTFGSFFFTIPLTEIISIISKISVKSTRSLLNPRNTSSFVYEINPISTDSVYVNSVASWVDNDFPINFPGNYIFTADNLAIPPSNITVVPVIGQGQAAIGDAFYQCPYCEQFIIGTGKVAVGHKSDCRLNPFRNTLWCEECHTDLTRNPHFYTCTKLEKCRICNANLRSSRHKLWCPLRR